MDALDEAGQVQRDDPGAADLPDASGLEPGDAARLLGDVFDGDRCELPTLSVSVVDTIGCGDAYFALSSVAASLRMPSRLVALVGSIGAAAMTQRRCNESAVTESEFLTIGKIVI